MIFESHTTLRSNSGKAYTIRFESHPKFGTHGDIRLAGLPLFSVSFDRIGRMSHHIGRLSWEFGATAPKTPPWKVLKKAFAYEVKR